MNRPPWSDPAESTAHLRRWFLDGPIAEEPVVVRLAAFGLAVAPGARKLSRHIESTAERFRLPVEAVARAVECLRLGWFSISWVQRGTWRAPGFVYAMERSGLVKIGHARRVGPRRAQIEREGGPVRVLAAGRFEDRFSVEKRLHRDYAARRVHGEWFALDSGEVAAVVEFLGGAVDDPSNSR